MKTLFTIFLFTLSLSAQVISYSTTGSTNGSATFWAASIQWTNSLGQPVDYEIPSGSNVTSISTATNIAAYIPQTYSENGPVTFGSALATTSTITFNPPFPNTNYILQTSGNSITFTLQPTGPTAITTAPTITVSQPTTSNCFVTLSQALGAGKSLGYTATVTQ